MELLVSAIVPVYNVSPWLREALDSLVQQTYSPVEIILVDDGSTDGSGKICDEYASLWPERIRVFHQENRGLSGARNAGLNHMHGDAVVFLDPDDAFDVEMIQKMVDALLRDRAEIAVCRYAVYRTGGRMETERAGRKIPDNFRAGVLSSGEALRALAEGKIGHAAWDKIYLRKIWTGLLYPDHRVYEDVSTTYQAFSRAERISLIPDVLVMHRVRAGSITQTKSLQNMRDWLMAMQEYEAFIRANTPGMFDERQLEKVRLNQLSGKVSQWTMLSRADQDKAKDIREEILRKGDRLMHEPVLIRVRIAYWMIRLCPRLIPVMLPVYRFLRRIAARALGR